MTVVYCSWTNGSDDTGDGSAGNPYKTITKASTGRSAGDEVRVEKSPDPTALTGTTAWTLNSTAVTGIGTAFTTELAIGDFISAPDGGWYEVITITDNTHATLYQKYPSATASGHSSKKLGITDTGAAAAATTQVQVVSSSGSSTDYIYISGGWDLSTATQTGQTWFRQLNTTTFAYRYGYGLYFNGTNYVSLDKLNFLRYNFGIYYNGSHNNSVTSATCNSNGSYGIYCDTSHNNSITNETCNSNGSYGIYYSNGNNNNIYSLSTSGNSNGGIYADNGVNICHNATIAESTKVAFGTNYYANTRQYINNLGGYSYVYSNYATLNSQNATAGGTGKEWKFAITDAARNSKYPFYAPIARVAVASSGKVTVKVYFKKSGTGIVGALRCRQKQIAWSDGNNDIVVECPNDTNRNQVTLEFTPTEAGVVEIEAGAWYNGATDQTVIIDDISISQA